MNSNSRYAGRCVNVAACALAAQGRDLTFEPGQPAVCPSCGSPVEILGVAWNQNATTEQRLPPVPPPMPAPVPSQKRTSPAVWIGIAVAAVVLFGFLTVGVYKAVVAFAMTPGVLTSPDPADSPDPSLSSHVFVATPEPPSTALTDAPVPSAHSMVVKNATSDTVGEVRYAGPGTGFGESQLAAPIAPGDSGASYRADSDPCTVDVLATIGTRPAYKDGVDICGGTLTVADPDPNSTDPTEWHFRKDVMRTDVPEALTPE